MEHLSKRDSHVVVISGLAAHATTLGNKRFTSGLFRVAACASHPSQNPIKLPTYLPCRCLCGAVPISNGRKTLPRRGQELSCAGSQSGNAADSQSIRSRPGDTGYKDPLGALVFQPFRVPHPPMPSATSSSSPTGGLHPASSRFVPLGRPHCSMQCNADGHSE